jgi:tRNA(adenine34) deaminase
MRDEAFMARALEVALSAQAKAGEPPFGVVIVAPDGTIVAEASDEVISRHDLSLHAEVVAVHRACAALGPVLEGYTLYTTVEPCPMCFTTAWLARITRVVFGCTMQEVKIATKGAQRELLVAAQWMNEHSGEPIELVGGVLSDRCLAPFSGK